MTAHWTLGVLIGLPIAILLILICLAAIAYGLLMRSSHSEYSQGREDGLMVSIVGSIVLLIVLIMTFIAFFPPKAEYHRWVPIQGIVTQVSKRLIANDSSMSERYVVVIRNQPYGIDDTRASLLHKGDHVRLMCLKEYQWASVPGYACRWGES